MLRPSHDGGFHVVDYAGHDRAAEIARWLVAGTGETIEVRRGGKGYDPASGEAIRLARTMHQRLDAVRAHLLEQAGDATAAAEHYRSAASKTVSLPERQYLLARAGVEGLL